MIDLAKIDVTVELLMTIAIPVLIVLLNVYKQWKELHKISSPMKTLSPLEQIWVKEFTTTLVKLLINDLGEQTPTVRREFLLYSMGQLESHANSVSNYKASEDSSTVLTFAQSLKEKMTNGQRQK